MKKGFAFLLALALLGGCSAGGEASSEPETPLLGGSKRRVSRQPSPQGLQRPDSIRVSQRERIVSWSA